MSDRLRVFVASSSEQINVARAVAAAFKLEPELDLHV